MKKNNNNTEYEIELTLKSLEGAECAKANPYLYQKVMARVHEVNSPKQTSDFNFGLNMKYAFVILAFVILNVVTIFQFSGQNKNVNYTPQSRETSEQSFAKKYIFGSVENSGENANGYSSNTYGY